VVGRWEYPSSFEWRMLGLERSERGGRSDLAAAELSVHRQEQGDEVLVWNSVYDLYNTESQTRAWPDKFVAQRFLPHVIEAMVSVSGGCVESSLACAYHTRRRQFPPCHRHHRLPTWNLSGVLSATRCIAETRDEMHVTAYLHPQVASWARTRVYQYSSSGLLPWLARTKQP